VFDYEVPLRDSRKNRKVGNIDLVSDDGVNVWLIEFKFDHKGDTLLRCALEIATYYQQLDRMKFLRQLRRDHSRSARKACSLQVRAGRVSRPRNSLHVRISHNYFGNCR